MHPSSNSHPGLPPLPPVADQQFAVRMRIRRGRGSTRVDRLPGGERERAARPSATWSSSPLTVIIATAAITALTVSAGGLLLQRVEPASQDDRTHSVAEVDADQAEASWAAVAERAGLSVVSVRAGGDQGTSQGSGVIWDAKGHIVTNHHVVGDSADIKVIIGNKSYRAKVIGSDPTTDLAVLRIAALPRDVTPIELATPDSVSIGDDVMAIGSPLGLDGSYTTGIVSALNRPVTTGKGDENRVTTNAIQTSAPLNPGNSGGALVNDRGELIGINSSIATLGKIRSGSIGIGFAIPSGLVEQITNELIATGNVEHAWLGVTAVDGEAPLVDGSLQLGAEVKDIDPSGPCHDSGLKSGDLITRINDTTITESAMLVGEVRTYLAGETVQVEVLREGRLMTFDITLAAVPKSG